MATVIDLKTIHEAAAATIRAAVSDKFTVRAFPMSGASAPLIELWPGEPYIPYSDPESDVNMVVRGFLAAGNAETTFERLAPLFSFGSVSERSIRDIIDSDPTLGGVVESCEWLDTSWRVDVESGARWFEIPLRIRATC